MDFEFGETSQSRAFFGRNPKFLPAFEQLMTTSNKCFGRQIIPRNRLEDVVFWLGHRCRQDFLEVAFLAVNGYGTAASKTLRGLYERAVVLAYMIDDPSKAERFVRFAAIQEHRALEAALKVVTEEEFDRAMERTSSTSQIREFYKKVKPEFQTTLCKKCGTSRTQNTWDLDVASMAHKVGDPFDKCYLIAYTIPNFDIHATLASAFGGPDKTIEREGGTRDAEVFLFTATHLLILTMRSQDELFSLNLALEIDTSERNLAEMCTS